MIKMIMMVEGIGEGLKMIDDMSKANAFYEVFFHKSIILTPQFYHIFKNLLILKLLNAPSEVFF